MDDSRSAVGLPRAVVASLAAMLLGKVEIYSCGMPWLARLTGWNAGFTQFLAGESITLVLAGALLLAAWRLTGSMASKRA